MMDSSLDIIRDKVSMKGATDTTFEMLTNQAIPNEEEKLIEVLKASKGAIGWSISDLKGISLTYCMHRIFMEDNYKLVAQPRRRLSPTMKEEVRKVWLSIDEVIAQPSFKPFPTISPA